MSVSGDSHNRSFVLKLKITNVDTIPTKSKPVKEVCKTPRESLQPQLAACLHNRSCFEQEPKVDSSVRTTMDSKDDCRKFDLLDSISCFRRILNEDDMRFRQCHSKEDLDSQPLRYTINSLSPQQERRNPTIVEETQETDSILPESELLDPFYRLLSCKYETLSDRLAYCELVLQLQQEFGRQHQAKHRHRLKFEPIFLCWYVNEWLGEMGFNRQDNKQRIVRSIVSFSKEESMNGIVEDCYGNLFGSYLPVKLHIMLLLEICRHGWQYFIFFAVRFLSYVRSGIEEEVLSESHWTRIESLIRNK